MVFPRPRRGPGRGKPRLAGRRLVAQGQRIERLKLKAMVVEDYSTLLKKIRNHLKKQGLENLVITDNDLMARLFEG